MRTLSTRSFEIEAKKDIENRLEEQEVYRVENIVDLDDLDEFVLHAMPTCLYHIKCGFPERNGYGYASEKCKFEYKQLNRAIKYVRFIISIENFNEVFDFEESDGKLSSYLMGGATDAVEDKVHDYAVDLEIATNGWFTNFALNYYISDDAIAQIYATLLEIRTKLEDLANFEQY